MLLILLRVTAVVDVEIHLDLELVSHLLHLFFLVLSTSCSASKHQQNGSHITTCVEGQLRTDIELLLEEVHRMLVHQERVSFLSDENMVDG